MKVKFESRVAGIVFFPPLIVSTIFRGGLRLDGILISISNSNPFIEALNMIKSSKFFDELNFIFFGYGDWSGLDIDYAYGFLGKPVIHISNSSVKFVGLSDHDFKRLMDIVCVHGEVEALRVSRIIALKLLRTVYNYSF
ncbi:MAG: hypothetical protein QXO82_05150 [Candidatus Methanomethylicia archaeon]